MIFFSFHHKLNYISTSNYPEHSNNFWRIKTVHRSARFNFSGWYQSPMVFGMSQNTRAKLLSSFVSALPRLLIISGQRLFLERVPTDRKTCSLTVDDRWERKNVTHKVQFRYTSSPPLHPCNSNVSQFTWPDARKRKKKKPRRDSAKLPLYYLLIMVPASPFQIPVPDNFFASFVATKIHYIVRNSRSVRISQSDLQSFCRKT